jgi:ADP-heptose:LPS heptosyltransferase
MMRVEMMRLADRWLGVPACAALSVWRKIAGTKLVKADPRRIVFIKLAEQGSTVLAAPAIRRAIEKVGRENVFFLVFAENRPILDAMALIPKENVISIATGAIGTTVMGAVRAIGRMRRERIDTVIDLEFFARSSAALAYLSGARWRVGFHPFAGEASYRGDLMTHRLSFNPHMHTSRTFETLVLALEASPASLPALDLGRRSEPFVPRFTAAADEQEAITKLLEDVAPGSVRAPLVLLNANASDLLPLRRWPPQRYVELARRLISEYPEISVAFTGAPDEARAAAALAAEVASPRCFSLAGRTTIRQLLALYSRAEVLVTNDSGPAHFAALTPIDVVTLFGPETPALFGAETPRSHVLWAGLACSPCVNAFNDRQSPCDDNICMQRITVDEVFRQVCALYDQRSSKPEINREKV